MNSYPVGLRKEDLDTPALCLDIEVLEQNIGRMASYLAERPTGIRPHSKTHKCPTIAWMQLRAGAIGITCAKLGEAEVMAKAGIQDILIANQIIGQRKITRLVNLATYSEVMVAVETLDNAREISAAAESRGVRLRTIIEVDVGMGRCGTAPRAATLALAKELVTLPGLRFEGIMGYEGHCVMITDMEKRREAATQAMQQLVDTRHLLVENGIPVNIVSAAGTGTYMITGNVPGITELQAGSYATMDARYGTVLSDFGYALTITTQVISVTGSDRAIVDAGLKTVTPEFGMPLVLNPQGWVMTQLSEEHGKLERQGGQALKPGDIVELVPGHGCTTINLHDVYHVIRDGIVAAVWPIAARGQVR